MKTKDIRELKQRRSIDESNADLSIKETPISRLKQRLFID